MKYVIKMIDSIGGISRTEYIGNSTYTINGEKYAVLVGSNIAEAKRYSSYKKAENAINKLHGSCVNLIGNFKIIEVEE